MASCGQAYHGHFYFPFLQILDDQKNTISCRIKVSNSLCFFYLSVRYPMQFSYLIIFQCVCYTLLCVFIIPASSGDIVLTHSPASVSDSRTEDPISCRSSHSVEEDFEKFSSIRYIYWFQHNPGQPPQLLIYGASNQFPEVPDQFSVTASETDFALTIGTVEAKAAVNYYCQQSKEPPPTVLQLWMKTSPGSCSEWLSHRCSFFCSELYACLEKVTYL